MKTVQQLKRARDLTLEDRADIIRRFEFGSSLSETLISDLARNAVVLDFRRRRFVYRAGDPAEEVDDHLDKRKVDDPTPAVLKFVSRKRFAALHAPPAADQRRDQPEHQP